MVLAKSPKWLVTQFSICQGAKIMPMPSFLHLLALKMWFEEQLAKPLRYFALIQNHSGYEEYTNHYG
jgi:hypothetical protein